MPVGRPLPAVSALDSPDGSSYCRRQPIITNFAARLRFRVQRWPEPVANRAGPGEKTLAIGKTPTTAEEPPLATCAQRGTRSASTVRATRRSISWKSVSDRLQQRKGPLIRGASGIFGPPDRPIAYAPSDARRRQPASCYAVGNDAEQSGSVEGRAPDPKQDLCPRIRHVSALGQNADARCMDEKP